MQEKEIRTVWEIVKRAFVLIFGLVVMAFGVAFSINAELGPRPSRAFLTLRLSSAD